MTINRGEDIFAQVSSPDNDRKRRMGSISLPRKPSLATVFRTVPVLAVMLFICFWMYSKTSSAAESRATLHLDSVHTLNFSGEGAMPIVNTIPPEPQDLRAFQEWLSPDRFDLSGVWFLGEQDIHPPLYMTLVHVLRVSGLEFHSAFLSVNLLGTILITSGIWISCRRDKMSLKRTCLALLFVALTPAAFAASQEARHWVLFAGQSMVSVGFLSSVTVSTLRGDLVRFRAYVLAVISVTSALLTETSFVLALLAWALVALLLSFISGRTREQMNVVFRVALPIFLAWLVLSPGALQHFRGATSLRSQGNSTASLLVPHLNTEISAWFLRRMGDLWQMGGDRRVTYALLIGSSILLLVIQVWVMAGTRRLPSATKVRREITHGFVVGLIGTVWTLIYFTLLSFEYLPTYAVGFKYVLPFGIFLLVGVYDAILRLRVPVLGALLMSGVMVYHADALVLAGVQQGAIVSEMLHAEGIAVVGREWDVANILYAINQVDRSSNPSVFYFASPSFWQETVCEVFPEDSQIAVLVDRPPWGGGLSDLIDGVGFGVEADVVGQLEFGEVGLVNVCLSRVDA